MTEQRAKLWLDSSSVNAAIVSKFMSACDKNIKKFGTNGKNRNVETSKDNPLVKSHDAESEGPSVYYKVSPVTHAKSVKNEAELEGMRSSHLR